MVPNDIQQLIEKTFSQGQRGNVYEIIKQYIKHDWEIYYQAARSLIFMSGGNINQLKELVQQNLDPRDQIMEGERKTGNPKHYFKEGFDQDQFDNQQNLTTEESLI